MRQILLKTGIAGYLVVIFIVASFSFSAQAAEKKKISASGKLERSISRAIVYLEDAPKHHLEQMVRIDTINSSDSDFNDIEVQHYQQSDSGAEKGSHKGYRIHFHKNGDKSYMRFEGTQKLIVKEKGAWEVDAEGKWQCTGGTGKFKSLKGSGTYKGKSTSKGSTYDWEGEVEY